MKQARQTFTVLAAGVMMWCLALLVPGLALAAQGSAVLYHTLRDFHQVSLAINEGTEYPELLAAQGIVPRFIYYKTLADSLLAVRQHKVEGYVDDANILNMVAGKSTDLRVLPAEDTLPVAFILNVKKVQLAQQVDTVIKQLKASGELAAIERKWFSSGEEGKVLPDLPPLPPDAPALRLGIEGESPPYTYVAAGSALGYEVEVALRVAHALGMRLEVALHNFDSLMPAVLSGRMDMAASCITITPERAEAVRFSEPTTRTAMGVVVRAASAGFASSAQAATGSVAATANKPVYSDIRSFDNVKVAASTGTAYESSFAAFGVRPDIVYFANSVDSTIALRQRKVEGVINDDIILQVAFGDQPDLVVLPSLNPVPTAFAMARQNEDLAEKIDRELHTLIQSGEVDALQKKWFAPGNTDKSLFQLPSPPPGAPVLRAIVSATSMPFVYMSEGHIVGYEVEVLMRVAHALGMRLELINSDFGGMLPALVSKRADIAAGCISVTPERAENVRFSVNTSQTGMTLLVRAENAVSPVPAATATTSPDVRAPLSFWDNLRRSFERNLLVESRWRMIVAGLWETVVISVGSLILGTAMGAGLCAMRRSHLAVPRCAARAYIRTIQGTPIVVLLMIFYYILFTDLPLSGTAVAIVAFSCNFAAYVAEMFRTSLDALDKGQQEAAVALGFSRWQTFRHVVLPQAARITLPVFKGEFVSLIKMTAVVGYIAVQDLTKVSDLIRSRTYEPFFPLILTAVIYFCLAYICIMPLEHLEARIDPKRRKRSIVGIAQPLPTAVNVPA